jgi:hypothetical protein
MYEQLLAFRPPGHAQRRQTVSDLGNALRRFCTYHSLNKARADCCIAMLREALHLCPPGHLLRDKHFTNWLELYTLSLSISWEIRTRWQSPSS